MQDSHFWEANQHIDEPVSKIAFNFYLVYWPNCISPKYAMPYWVLRSSLLLRLDKWYFYFLWWNMCPCLWNLSSKFNIFQTESSLLIDFIFILTQPHKSIKLKIYKNIIQFNIINFIIPIFLCLTSIFILISNNKYLLFFFFNKLNIFNNSYYYWESLNLSLNWFLLISISFFLFLLIK